MQSVIVEIARRVRVAAMALAIVTIALAAILASAGNCEPMDAASIVQCGTV